MEGLALSATCPALLHHGLGKPVVSIKPNDLEIFSKLTFTSYFLFLSGSMIFKMSALFFYERIFGKLRSFRHALYITHALVLIVLTIFIFTTIFQCTPVDRVWRLEKSGRCIDQYAWCLYCAAADVLLDFVVLLLPMPMLWTIHCGMRKKISIFLAFVFGYL